MKDHFSVAMHLSRGVDVPVAGNGGYSTFPKRLTL
jgi:hypothetical protein